jgi:putative colanic acid biosynthesis acetyltransferase WcaF
MQRLDLFRVPAGFRGRSAVFVQLWWVVQASLFRWSPQFMYGFRRWLLRLFGARIGERVLIRPTATVTYPWKLTVGDHSWIGDDVVLYSLGPILVGNNSVISQNSYVCAADHDYRQADFPIRERPIRVGSGVWVAAGTFVGPGVTIGDGAVVGARSAIFESLPARTICYGHPCRPVKPREMLAADCAG